MFQKNKILISGYTYVDENSRKTFDHYPEKNCIYFLVPDVWPQMGSKRIFKTLRKDNIYPAKTFFHHSSYPIIGGILKGWMPVFPFVLIKQRPDIVFSASEPNLLTTLYQGIFAKLFGAKHIIFTWENVPYETKFKGLKGIVQRVIVKLNLWLCDGVVCGNKKAEQIIKSLIDKPTTIMPLSGVDTDFFTRNNSKKSFQDKDYSENIVFCFAGAIGYRKGVHLIIKAFNELSKTISDTRLIIAGSGEYEKEISELIEKSEAKNAIIRVPWLNKTGLRELLNASDIFLYPSIPYAGWEEQFGYSLAEASSMELPLITTESGSISEVVLNGKTGVLIKPNDYTALKEAMSELANDKEKRILMGKTGRQFVVNTYGHEVIAGKFYDFFNNI